MSANGQISFLFVYCSNSYLFVGTAVLAAYRSERYGTGMFVIYAIL